MSKPNRRRFTAYVRRIADMLGLKDWEVEVGAHPPDKDAEACVTCAYGRRSATICLSDYFLDSSRAQQRRIIVHELIHLHVEAPWHIALAAIPENVEAPFVMAAEYAVDGIAAAIATFFPLPPA